MLNSSDFHLPYNRALVPRAKQLRHNMTTAEKKLWYGYLKNFRFRVLRQRPIDYFIVDFYCSKLKLVIEVDGESHFTNEGQEDDQHRTLRLESYGLKIIRFTNEEILNNFADVCSMMEALIPPQSPLQKGGGKNE